MEEQNKQTIPFTIEVNKTDNGVEIIRSWFNVRVAIQLMWVIIVPAVLGFILSQINLPLLTTVVMTGVGIYALKVIVSCINKTHFTIQRGQILISHRPIPWFGPKKIATHEISQLYVKENTHAQARSQGSQHSTLSYTYAVQVKLKRGSEITMASNIANCDEAKYIEQTIEDLLNIEDRPMENEYRPEE